MPRSRLVGHEEKPIETAARQEARDPDGNDEALLQGFSTSSKISTIVEGFVLKDATRITMVMPSRVRAYDLRRRARRLITREGYR